MIMIMIFLVIQSPKIGINVIYYFCLALQFLIMMGLNDLPIEMVGHILSFLSMEDLLNVGDTNKRLRDIVLQDYRINFDTMCVFLNDFDIQEQEIYILKDAVKIYGVKYILKFVRLFGLRIKILTINSWGAFEFRFRRVFKYINRYCVSLKRINFISLTYDISCRSTKPFKTVEALSFKDCTVCTKLCNVCHWFPRLKEFDLIGINRFERGFRIVKRYPFLERMLIHEDSRFDFYVSDLQALNPLSDIVCYSEIFDY